MKTEETLLLYCCSGPRASSCPTYEIAKLYAALGERDRVFEWLDRAFDQRDGNMIHFNVPPELDWVRADPRYVNLARRMNLAPSKT